MRKVVKGLSVILAVVCTGILGLCIQYDRCLPDEYVVNTNEQLILNDFNTISYNNQSKKEIKVNGSVSGEASSGQLMLLNIVPIKDVTVTAAEKKYAVPCGNIFGIKFHTKGVVVIKCDDITVNGKTYNPGRESGLKAGDIIMTINGTEICDCKDMQNAIYSSGGEQLSIEYCRQGQLYSTNINPIETNSNGNYKVGVWIKDSCAGLGTMTFYIPDTNYFASLGHGICDGDTGELLPLDSAEITKAEIGSITKGTDGLPGSINGYFEDNSTLGQAIVNNETGLYGVLSTSIGECEPVEIANIQEVKKGSAQILCTLDNGEAEYYSIDITHVNYDEANKTKNLQITVTDERLLEKTGGIVQGMSGSPILQNGKLIGAVTHVLVTNSAKGYGIFAQNMYEEIEKNLFVAPTG